MDMGHPDATTTLCAHPGNLVPAIAEGRPGALARKPSGHVARTGTTRGTPLFFAARCR